MMQLIFATNNLHKLSEVRHLLGNKFQVKGLKEIGIDENIPENKETIEGNAIEKAEFIFNKYHLPCFADDTGLEVDFLDGKPGVYSARYAGKDCSSEDNIHKLLNELNGNENRKAQFRTVIAFVESIYEIKLFEGIVKGKIAYSKTGNEGFGYDPVFIPDGFNQSFAEMDLNTKNNISHRALAMNKLINYLKSK